MNPDPFDALAKLAKELPDLPYTPPPDRDELDRQIEAEIDQLVDRLREVV